MSFLLRIALLCFLVGTSAAALPNVLMTRDEALELAFPESKIERCTVFLTEEQRGSAEKWSGARVPNPIVYPYVASKEGAVQGYAYFDTHKVRTLKETLMVVVGPDHRIRRVEVLAFGEPMDYVPRGSWYDQFKGRELDAELELKRGVKNVTGATLTAVATTEGARRVLAVHRAVYGETEEVAQR